MLPMSVFRGFCIQTEVLAAISIGTALAASEVHAQESAELSPVASRDESAMTDYPGRSVDAEWRNEAAERIDEVRKADLTVVVTDGDGKAIKEAEVAAKLKRHAFLFGTTVRVGFRKDTDGNGGEVSTMATVEVPAGKDLDDESRAAYREKLFEYFTTATPREEISSDDAEVFSAWLRARGFQPNSEPVEAVAVPARPTPEALVPPEQLWKDLEDLAKAGKPLVATGYAMPVDMADPAQLQLQADYTRDYFTVLFSHPKVREIFIAGFWAPTSEVEGWALFDENWSIRPVGQAFIDLTTRIWNTDEAALTDAAGKAKIRGFLGRYRISVSFGAKTKTVSADLPAEGVEVVITLE